MKRFLELTDVQMNELKERISKEKHTKIYKRLIFIQLKTNGSKNTEIQKQLGISSNTCSNWLSIFLSSGFP